LPRAMPATSSEAVNSFFTEAFLVVQVFGNLPATIAFRFAAFKDRMALCLCAICGQVEAGI